MEARDTQQQPTRIFEMRLPITWLITISIPILWAAVQLYFTVGVLKDTVTELRSTVSILAKTATDTQRDISLLGYRVDNMEKRLQDLGHGKD
ncbi:gp093 [Erwinia phage vB_EamP-S6]|uniref:Gp093 n=1 Tax=Erwinia phage vB_EamP-S6 TaxID=1051675 RepID=G0YQI5_9CAUD|nr:gp093 [Erwinia phage vB_EamP-S6]AEJ81612.1 gp093 [Erwinia phage vB_EamP-S6]